MPYASSSANVSDPCHSIDAQQTFVRTDEQHAQYLTPAFALSGTLPATAPPEYADMSPAELAAVAAELEPDIRAADNDMREIAALQQRGVTGAGSLSGTHTPCPHHWSSIRTLTPTHGRRRGVAATTRGASIATRRGSRARCCPREARRKDRPTVCPAGTFGFAYRLCPPLCTRAILRRSTVSLNFL